MRQKQQYIILTPKTDKGRQRIGNHGERWIYRGIADMKFVRTGPVMRVMSTNGDVVLCIQEKNDPDFDTRLIPL